MNGELELSPAGRRYGFHPSPPDHRDFGLASAPLSSVSGLVPEFDLEPWCGPIFDQGQQGSCTANAGCGNAEYLFRRFQNKSVVLSRSFLYYLERQQDGTLAEGDSGSTGRTSCAVMNQFGLCLDADMPYKDSDFTTAPNGAQLGKALAYKAGAYHVVGVLADVKSCLVSGYPLLMGFAVYNSFESSQVADTGVMPVPDKTKEQLLGGHETLIIGYDDAKQSIKVRNSWGSSWGAGGNFWMPYACVADPDVVWELRMQHLGPAWK